jgi:hypothetical protein
LRSIIAKIDFNWRKQTGTLYKQYNNCSVHQAKKDKRYHQWVNEQDEDVESINGHDFIFATTQRFGDLMKNWFIENNSVVH